LAVFVPQLTASHVETSMRRFASAGWRRTMSEKPSYLGLLNAIAVAEGDAHDYLRAWAAKTPSDDVRCVLLKVAAREGEHAMSFTKRINELGYEVRRKSQPSEERLALVSSDRSDLEKMRALKLHRLDSTSKPDIFDDFFKDHSIDVATGELLGRYIAEERDTGRLLRACYEQLKAAGGAGDERDADRLTSLERKVDALCRAVDHMREALSVSAGSNGAKEKARSK
jgi:rubrerythrin